MKTNADQPNTNASVVADNFREPGDCKLRNCGQRRPGRRASLPQLDPQALVFSPSLAKAAVTRKVMVFRAILIGVNGMRHTTKVARGAARTEKDGDTANWGVAWR